MRSHISACVIPSCGLAIISARRLLASRTARVRLAWEGLLVPIEGFGLRDALQGSSGGAKDVYSEFGDLLVH